MIRVPRRLARPATVLLLTPLLLLAACSQASLDEIEPEVGVTEVAVKDNRFAPRVIEIAPGTEVTWTWEGSAQHNVVGSGWTSEIIKEGTFTHVFVTAGTFEYVCTLHAGMTGRVVVR